MHLLWAGAVLGSDIAFELMVPTFQSEETENKQLKWNVSHREDFVEKPKQGVGTEIDLGQGKEFCFLESGLEGPSAQGESEQSPQAPSRRRG